MITYVNKYSGRAQRLLFKLKPRRLRPLVSSRVLAIIYCSPCPFYLRRNSFQLSILGALVIVTRLFFDSVEEEVTNVLSDAAGRTKKPGDSSENLAKNKGEFNG